MHVFLLFITLVFPMFDKSQDCSSKCGCILRTVRGTWNFVRQQATPAQGRAGEAHMNTDVNLRRLPDKRLSCRNSQCPLQDLSASVPDGQSCDCVKATERQSDSKKNMHLRTTGILYQIKQYTLRNSDFLQSIHFCNHQKKIKTLYLNQSLEIKCHPCNNFIDQSI